MKIRNDNHIYIWGYCTELFRVLKIQTALHFGQRRWFPQWLLTLYITCLRGTMQTGRKGDMSSVFWGDVGCILICELWDVIKWGFIRCPYFKRYCTVQYVLYHLPDWWHYIHKCLIVCVTVTGNLLFNKIYTKLHCHSHNYRPYISYNTLSCIISPLYVKQPLQILKRK